MRYFNLSFLLCSCFIMLMVYNGHSQNKITQDSVTLSAYKNDRIRLNERLANTEKIWDSLDYILRKRPVDTIYRNAVRKQFKGNKDLQLIVYQNFILDNPNSILSAETLNNLKFLYGKEITQKLFDPMSEKIKNAPLGLDISNFIELYQNPKVNEAYIDFELPNLNGEQVKLSNLLGTYTLIEFWASWCVPCRRSNPELVEIYKTYKNKGLIIIGVSIDDDKQSWTQAVEEDGLVWLHVSDLKGKENTAAIQYGVTAVPTNFLINDKGIIIAKNIDLDMLKKVIQ